MMKKEMLLIISMNVFVMTNIIAMEEDGVFQRTGEQVHAEPRNAKQPKVFNKGKVEIDGNELFMWLHVGGYQSNPSPQFAETTIVKLKKNGQYETQFQLKDIKKAYARGPLGRTAEDNKKMNQNDDFDYYAKANNAVECPGLIELPNREGELKPVTVAIYGTQNIKHCELYKQYLEQAKKTELYMD
jgi:hypothetical protein